jgi:16S rRNA (guanine527-N7)-methyltransferase
LASRVSDCDRRIHELLTRFRLDPAVAPSLSCLLDMLVRDPLAPTTVRDPDRVIADHLADSLVALELPEVRDASAVVDIGAGAGLPGLPLAVALRESTVILLESARRKSEFLLRIVSRCAVTNAEVVNARVEAWPAGLRRFDLATARALAALPVVLEYAAPLLVLGGSLVVWRGGRDPEEEAAAERAGQVLGLRLLGIHQVRPYPEAQRRHLHVWSKVMETPDRFPRRPGMAAKRPLSRS